VRVVVKLFAGLRERAGTGTRELELPAGATTRDVWAPLDLGEEPNGLLYAVNKRYAEPADPLADGDEVALIPPVSGGAFRLVEGPLEPAAAAAEVASDEAGAIATFVGTVRRRSRGREVVHPRHAELAPQRGGPLGADPLQAGDLGEALRDALAQLRRQRPRDLDRARGASEVTCTVLRKPRPALPWLHDVLERVGPVRPPRRRGVHVRRNDREVDT